MLPVPDPSIFCYHNPTTLPDFGNPLFVDLGGVEVLFKSMHHNPLSSEGLDNDPASYRVIQKERR